MARSRLKSIMIPCCLVMFCLALSACSGGPYTSKVNRSDGQGTKAGVQETDQDGQTTIQNTQDSKTKRQGPGQHITEQRRAKKVEQLETLRPTPRRQPNDPIYVNLTPPVLDSKMQQMEKSKGAVERQIRIDLTSDPIIKLIEGDRMFSDRETSRDVPSIADVEVSPKVSIKDVYVLQPHTGKPGKMTAVVFEATITCQDAPVTSTVSETGEMLQKVETSK